MRALALLTAVLFVLPLVPAAAAQAADGADLTLEDPSGDVTLSVRADAEAPGAPLPAGPVADPVDLLSLRMEETAMDLRATLEVAGFNGEFEIVRYLVYFTHDGAEYALTGYVTRSTALGADWNGAWLARADQEGDYRRVTEVQTDLDRDAGTITMQVSKLHLQDPNGRIPVVGSDLTDVWAQAETRIFSPDWGGAVYDQVPDAASDAGTLTFQKGNEATGHLRLTSEDPVRVSNGAATTIVFQAEVANLGDRNDEVTLEVADAPEAWDVSVPSPLTVPAGETKKVHVLASVPFAHQHGGFDGLNLTATSGHDPDTYATLMFGVLHTVIAQPAGHHPDLYLHAESANQGIFSELFPWSRTYMNTDAAHDNDLDAATPNDYRGRGSAWRIPLGPGLAMGLDFDVNGVGTLVGTIEGSMPSEASLYAELVLRDGDSETVLATEEAPLLVTTDVGARTPFELTLVPTEDADYVPYDPGQNVVLYLSFDPEGASICCPPHTAPELVVEDFKLTLPLNEYHDRAPVLTDEAAGPQLTPKGATQKSGKPGTVVAYGFTLENAGRQMDQYALELTGNDAGQAVLEPRGVIELGPGESRDVVIQVEVPGGANDGQTFEVLVTARSQTDASRLAIGSTLTTASSTAAADAEGEELIRSAKENKDKDAPLPLGLAVLGLAAGALARRRRT